MVKWLMSRVPVRGGEEEEEESVSSTRTNNVPKEFETPYANKIKS